MDSKKIFNTRNEVLSYMMELVNSDVLIPDDIKLRVRYYLSITYGATFEVVSKKILYNRTYPVRAISPQGNKLGEWPTVKQAALEMGCDPRSIYNSIHKARPMYWGKSAGNKLYGVKWEHAKEATAPDSL